MSRSTLPGAGNEATTDFGTMSVKSDPNKIYIGQCVCSQFVLQPRKIKCKFPVYFKLARM
jgi:hypothetical protein